MDWKRIIWHVIFWIVIVVCTSAVYDKSKGIFIWTYIQFNLIRLPLILTTTYVVLYGLIPRYLINRKQYWHFAGYFIVTVLLTILLDRIIIGSQLIGDLLAETKLKYRFFSQVPIVRNAFLLVATIGLATMIRFFKLYLKQERHKHQLQEAKLATELAFLKAQVNPHFLFNTLNNLYSMAVQKEQPELAEGLANLSGIMRYLTYDSNASTVPLAKEIELLQQYIEIQRLRQSEQDDITIVFNIKGVARHHQIAPVLLLPIVENAFKHGVLPGRESLVLIDLEVKEEKLYFQVKNTLHPKQNPALEKHGIGLKNVRKRLELLYPKGYSLETKAVDQFYISNLDLHLQ